MKKAFAKQYDLQKLFCIFWKTYYLENVKFRDFSRNSLAIYFEYVIIKKRNEPRLVRPITDKCF